MGKNNIKKGWVSQWNTWSQQAITCSKLKIETLEQGEKYVQFKVNNKDTRTTPILNKESSALYTKLLLKYPWWFRSNPYFQIRTLYDIFDGSFCKKKLQL